MDDGSEFIFYFILCREKHLFSCINDRPISWTFPLGGIHENVNNFSGTFVYFLLAGSGNFFVRLVLFLLSVFSQAMAFPFNSKHFYRAAFPCGWRSSCQSTNSKTRKGIR